MNRVRPFSALHRNSHSSVIALALARFIRTQPYLGEGTMMIAEYCKGAMAQKSLTTSDPEHCRLPCLVH